MTLAVTSCSQIIPLEVFNTHVPVLELETLDSWLTFDELGGFQPLRSKFL